MLGRYPLQAPSRPPGRLPFRNWLGWWYTAIELRIGPGIEAYRHATLHITTAPRSTRACPACNGGRRLLRSAMALGGGMAAVCQVENAELTQRD